MGGPGRTGRLHRDHRLRLARLGARQGECRPDRDPGDPRWHLQRPCSASDCSGSTASPRRRSSAITSTSSASCSTRPSVGGGQDAGAAAALAFIRGCANCQHHAGRHATLENERGVLGGGLSASRRGQRLPPRGPAQRPGVQPTPAGLVLRQPVAGYFVNPAGSAPPTSNHPGGVNIGFADGSVRFIKDSIGLQPWWAIGTRAGGEVVSSDQY